MHRTIRFAVLALALMVAGAGAVHARPLAVSPSPTGFLGALWQWLSPFLPAWTKEGSSMDPNGGRPPGFTAPTGGNDAGGMMDPDGLTKEGSDMDPNGRRLFNPPSSDAGGTMDPNG
jgi:hypothetical protein